MLSHRNKQVVCSKNNLIIGPFPWNTLCKQLLSHWFSAGVLQYPCAMSPFQWLCGTARLNCHECLCFQGVSEVQQEGMPLPALGLSEPPPKTDTSWSGPVCTSWKQMHVGQFHLAMAVVPWHSWQEEVLLPALDLSVYIPYPIRSTSLPGPDPHMPPGKNWVPINLETLQRGTTSFKKKLDKLL